MTGSRTGSVLCLSMLALFGSGPVLAASGPALGTDRSGRILLDSIPVRVAILSLRTSGRVGTWGRSKILRRVSAWNRKEGGLSWEHRGRDALFRLSLVQAGPGMVALDTIRSYRRSVYVLREHVIFSSPCDKLEVWDRTERLVPVRPRHSYHVDRWTGRYARISWHGHSWSVAWANGLSGMTVSRSPAGRCTVVLELDDSRNHPAVYASLCKKHWYPPSPRRLRSRRFRRAGESVAVRVSLGRGLGSAFVPARLPHGFAAAVVFTDHADQSAPGPLRALLLGRSDASAEHPVGGFVGHGLGLTKTLFWRNGPAPQFDDPGVQALVKKVGPLGIEFGPHSATPQRDSRRVTEQALAAFKGLGRTWIDHQPDTNCEAYSCRGWRRTSPFFIADLLVKYGFDLVWTGRDAKPPGGLNMFEPSRSMARPAILFPFHVSPLHPGRLWLWRSVWFYEGPKGMARRLSERALARLVAHHGLLVAHSYLDDHHPPGHRRHRMALVHRVGGVWQLAPRFEAVLSRLGRLQSKGTLWVPSFRRLAAYLIAWDQIFVSFVSPGGLVVHNPTQKKMSGYGLWVEGKPCPGGAVRVARSVEGWTLLLMDIPASGSIHVPLTTCHEGGSR